jgi:hypothetical protein
MKLQILLFLLIPRRIFLVNLPWIRRQTVQLQTLLSTPVMPSPALPRRRQRWTLLLTTARLQLQRTHMRLQAPVLPHPRLPRRPTGQNLAMMTLAPHMHMMAQ